MADPARPHLQTTGSKGSVNHYMTDTPTSQGDAMAVLIRKVQRGGEVADFIADAGVTLPVLLGDGQTLEDWSINAFPTYYVIDAAGNIDSRSVGYSSWLGMRWRAWLAAW